MEGDPILVLGLFVLAYGLVSSRLEHSVITPPMVFAGFGMIACPSVFGWLDASLEDEWIQLVTSLTLVMVLFIDASRIRLRSLREDYTIPLRLLGIGLPLTVVLGAVVAILIFPDFTYWEALLLGAMLAPTDASLGQSVVTHPNVPVRIRQALNVESGLNDGLVLPLVLLFAGCAAATAVGSEGASDGWLFETLQQLSVGPLAGIGVGLAAGAVIHWGREFLDMSAVFQRLCDVALALLAFFIAEHLGGNGFLAAFLAGVTFGNIYPVENEKLHVFFESITQLLVLISFVVYGAVMVWPSLSEAGPMVWVYALLSLTVVRILPVMISLWKTPLDMKTRWFLAWSGPRGLASILYGLVVVSTFDFEQKDAMFAVIAVTVLMSIVLHGASALPSAAAYGRYMRDKVDPTSCAEMAKVDQHPMRRIY